MVGRMADPETPPSAPDGTKKTERALTAERLTARQSRFIEHYVADPNRNAYQAALKAGYSEWAAKRASDLLANPHIAAEINRKLKLIEVKSEVTVASVLQELARLGFSNMGDYMRVTSDGQAYVDLSNLTPAQWAAIEEVQTEEYKQGRGEDARDIIKTKIKLASKNVALTTIAKYLGMLHDKLEVVHKYEEMNGATLAAKRTEIAEKRAAVAARLREEGIEVPGIAVPKTTAPSTDTVQ